MTTIYKICIPNTKHDYFDYLSTDDLEPSIGGRVWVPFRSKIRLGLIIAKENTEIIRGQLKSISAVIDELPLVDESTLSLCQWVSSYYQAPLSEVIPLALPKKYRDGEEISLPMTEFIELAIDQAKAEALIPARAKKQKELINFLAQQDKTISKTALINQGFNHQLINRLLMQKIINLSKKIDCSNSSNQTRDKPLVLNSEQTHALNIISDSLDHYGCFLLQGVTGSGKTEVYLQLIAKILARGQQVLVLVPEIGLTPQLLDRFRSRFSQPIAVIHSNLNESERQIAWQLAKDGQVSLIIGTRAAIFTPMPKLAMIIIDEEHDSSLKQIEGVHYSARDTALMRAYLAKIPIILGSATPSLESLYNAAQNKYHLLRLNQRAIAKQPLCYQVVDIRSLKLQEGLASITLDNIAKHLSQGNQVLVFINRRGFAPVLLCHHCGSVSDCSHCDSHLTLHRQQNRLVCHHCGLNKAVPSHCSSCQSSELLPIGIGTQRIHEFLQEQFPKISLIRIDRDETRKKNALDKQLHRISQGEVQLIVGTQMLAKGHHFPRLALVVVLDIDAGFYNQDFRALERIGQLLTQVSGRAGRAEHPGQVLIQTHLADNPLLNLLVQQGYDAFAKALLIIRQQAELPPFRYLAVIRAEDKLASKVLHFLHQIKQQLEKEYMKVLGPAPAPLARKANQHRMQLLIKSSSRKNLNQSLIKLRSWLAKNKLSSNIRWNIDVDPIDLS